MVATLTSLYHGEESLPIQGICAKHRGRPEGARWGQNYRSFSQPGEYILVEGLEASVNFMVKIGQFIAARQLSVLRSPCYHF